MTEEESPYLKRLKASLGSKPDSRLFLPLAEELWRRGAADVAIGIVEEGLTRHPNFTAARCALGWWYLLRDRPLDAERQLLETVRRDPGSLRAHRLFAGVLSRLGKTGEAAAEYRKVLDIRPLDPEAHRALGERSGITDAVTVAGQQAAVDPSLSGPDGTAANIIAEAEDMLARGLHARAVDLYTSALVSDAKVWRVVQRRDEAQALLRAAQRERKQAALQRLERLRTAVKDRFPKEPPQDQPPLRG